MLRLSVCLLFVLTFTALSIWPGESSRTAQAAITNLSATITNAQEVPPTTPTLSGGGARPASFGTASFVLNDTTPSMTMTVTVFNVDCTGTQTADVNDNLIAAHIHSPGIPGVNGPVVWGFFGAPFNDNNPNDQVVTPFATGAGCTITGKWDAPEGNGTTLAAQIANILAGNAYINFHTTQFGGGELRGQILPAGAAGADLTATKSNSVGGAGTIGAPWTWTIRVANGGTSDAVFQTNLAVLTDNLPSGNISYGAASIASPVGVTNAAALTCSIAANVLSCITTGGPMAISAGGSFNVTFTATATAAGTFANPTGGICRTDPANVVAESNEANNDCANTVTVGAVVVATVTPTATVVAPIAPAVIPQVFQNPNAVPAIVGGLGNGTRNNTPVPAPVAVAPQVDPGVPVLRPPSTGDAGLAHRFGRLWSAF